MGFEVVDRNCILQLLVLKPSTADWEMMFGMTKKADYHSRKNSRGFESSAEKQSVISTSG
jgi:hypothetical protein